MGERTGKAERQWKQREADGRKSKVKMDRKEENQG